ncbi:MAG: thioesterase II family protein [Trebonia sp.]
MMPDGPGTGSLVRLSPPSSAPRLLCLPYAGGRGELYRGWVRDLAGRAEVWAADLPGRFRRTGREPVTDPDLVIAEISAEAAPLTDRPLVLFGHSMGALLGFEVARVLEAAGHEVAALIVSASPAPHLRAARAPAGPESDEQLVARLRSWGTTDDGLLANREFLELVLPPLRADLTLCDRYQYRPGPLRAPLMALAGAADPVAPWREVAAWKSCAADWRGVVVIPGQHLFLTTAQPHVLIAIATFLARMTAR